MRVACPSRSARTALCSNNRIRQSACIATLLLLYALLKRDAVNIAAGDQGIYYYASWLWTQGIVPHRDFFLSHSPLQLLIPSAIILPVTTVFGKGVAAALPLLNALPAVIGGLSGIMVFSIARKPLGFPTAFLATALFLFSYANLSPGSHYTGQELATFLLLGATMFFLGGNMLTAGIMLGLASSTAVNAIVALPVFCLMLLKRPGELRRFAIGFASTFALLHLLFFFLSGPAFFEQVYLYHFLKPAGMRFAPKTEVLMHLLKAHAVLVGLAIADTVPMIRRGATVWRPVAPIVSSGVSPCLDCTGRHSVAPLHTPGDLPAVAPLRTFAALFTGLYLLFLLSLKQLFLHYALPLVPFVAIAAAASVTDIVQRSTKRYALIAGSIPAALLFFTAVHTTLLYRNDRALMDFRHVRDIARHINATLGPEETLYGDFGVTPMVALLSGRRIAANEIDSSVMRFRSGVAKLGNVIAAIEADNVGAIITRTNRAIGIHPPFRKYMEERFALERTFRLPAGRHGGPGSGTVVELWLKHKGAR